MTTNPITARQSSPRALATRSLTASTGPTYSPSKTALAARSMRVVERITDTDERRVAFARHMEKFPPLIGR